MRNKSKRKRYFDHRATQEHYAKTHKEEPQEELIYLYPKGTYFFIGELPHLVRVQPISKVLYNLFLQLLKPRYLRSKEEIFQEIFKSILPRRNGAIILRTTDYVVSEWNEDIYAFVPTGTLSSGPGYLNDIDRMIENL